MDLFFLHSSPSTFFLLLSHRWSLKEWTPNSSPLLWVLSFQLLKYNLHLILGQVLQTVCLEESLAFLLTPPGFSSWSSSSRLVVQPSTDIWNLSVFLFLHLAFSWLPKLNSSTYMVWLLSFSFLLVSWVLCAYQSFIFSSHFISNSVPFLILPYPLPTQSPKENTKAFFCLLYLLNIYCTKAWNGTFTISLFKL